MAEKKQENLALSEEETALVSTQLARIRTYQGLMNEASTSLEGIIKLLATQRKLNLSEYGLSEDGSTFVKRATQAPAGVN